MTNPNLHPELVTDKTVSDMTSTEFQRAYPDSGDQPIWYFSDDELAYRYSKEYSRCVYDTPSYECVYCHRADH